MRKTKTFLWLILIFLLISLSFLFDNFAFLIFEKIKSNPMDLIMNFFSNAVVIVLFLTIASIFSYKKTHHLIVLWTSILITSVIVFFMKLIVARARPDDLQKFLFGFPDYSFPSMHTALMFSAVFIFWKNFPREKWFFIFYAFLVGISRVYLKMHYLSDVVSGMCIGFFIGYFVYFIEKKHHFFDKFIRRF